MKRFFESVALIFACASTAWGADPAATTTLSAIHAMTNADVTPGLPVAFEATVTYFRGYERALFVQDGDVAIFVKATTEAKLVTGDRILVRGTALRSFRPFVLSDDIAFIRHGTRPNPVPANFDQLMSAQRDCLLVTVHGIVRTADLTLSSMTQSITLQMLTDGGTVDVSVDSADPGELQELLDSEVEVTGTASGQFDGKMQQTGVLIHVSSLADVRIQKRANADPWSSPITPMDEILRSYHSGNLSQRIRVHGAITYYQPGVAVVLQDGTKSLWIMTQSIAPLRIGDHADAIGFPDVHDGFLTLTGSEVRATQAYAPISALAATWRDLVSSKHVFDLVSIEGTVVTSIRETSQDEYVLVSDGYQFSAIYRHPEAGVLPLAPMAQVPVGSRVRISGICVLDSANPFNRDVPFNILLRSSDDIAIVAEPSWLSIRNLIFVVVALLILVIAVGAWGWTLKSKVHRQTAALATRIAAEADLERRRSAILENINRARPLSEILEQIAALISFRLDGTPCWCEIADGTRFGISPLSTQGLRVAHEQIQSRVGAPLGTFFAGSDPCTQPNVFESEALIVGTRLATLAIETHRLYSDLLHRSEFDLLTDIHNRFALEKRVDAVIEEAHLRTGIFGLIYIDLDYFKQVNDRYGHQIGDHYLEQAALRMKRQLRTHDTLARLGGDEFAVLVPVARSRTDVEEVALRLERCFDDPFAIEGYILHGSASIGIALYPEDGATKDSLLRTSDAAMYVAKHTKLPVGIALADQ